MVVAGAALLVCRYRHADEVVGEREVADRHRRPLRAVAGARRRTCKAVFGPGFQTGFWLAVLWLVAIVALAALAGVLPLQGPRRSARTAKGFIRPSLFSAHPLGTDEFGRDELARLIYGARPSLIIGVCAATTGMVVGTVLGILAGYYRGKVEALIDLMTDVALLYPPLVLLLAMVAFLAAEPADHRAGPLHPDDPEPDPAVQELHPELRAGASSCWRRGPLARRTGG